MHVGQHADVAELETALTDDRGRQRARLLHAGAQEGDRRFLVGPRSDGDEELFPGVDRVSVDGRDAVAGLDVCLRRGRTGGHDADHRRLILVRALVDALIQHQRGENQREQDVHHRPHDQDLEPLPLRLRQELVGLAGAFFFRVLARHLHVAAERQRADAVFGVAAAEADDGRVETELELQDANADTLGGEKMTKFVHEHEHAEHERKRE